MSTGKLMSGQEVKEETLERVLQGNISAREDRAGCAAQKESACVAPCTGLGLYPQHGGRV